VTSRRWDLAAASSAALTQADVANALIERIPTLVGARGGAVGLVDGDAVVVVDPRTGIGVTHEPGARIPLTARAPIARAAATGESILVRDRESVERLFPDGIALTDYARAAVAVPLRVAGEVVGAVSFLFDDEEAMTEDAEAVALTPPRTSAVRRSSARGSRPGVRVPPGARRILRVSPAFHADDPVRSPRRSAARRARRSAPTSARSGRCAPLNSELVRAHPPTEELHLARRCRSKTSSASRRPRDAGRLVRAGCAATREAPGSIG
jgi:hypothetical protein